jgi:ATP-dependent DNA helicase RecQ
MIAARTMANAVLREVFGHPEFRGGQEEAVTAVMHRRDAAVLLPTGGGKSLCY